MSDAVSAAEESWRGRLDESTEDLPIDEAVPRGREARALLADLLLPYRSILLVLAAVVVIENVARLAIPLMVKRGIPRSIPRLTISGIARRATFSMTTTAASTSSIDR